MIFNFETDNESSAIAALLVYSIYRSRDNRKFKVSTDMWGRIDRFVKSSAKRARNIPQFIDSFMPKVNCASINPRWMKVGITSRITEMQGGLFAEFSNTNTDGREFLTRMLETPSALDVVNKLYKETTFIILLVRDRLEREKPIEQKMLSLDQDEEL